MLEFAEDVLDDALLILGLQRNDLQRNLGLIANGARAGKVFFPRTITKKREFLLQPDLEVESGDFVALRFCEMQGHGAVHPTRE